jgi:mRNA-degrading endonuclease toxin of MazEF toxin-antitoxin module
MSPSGTGPAEIFQGEIYWVNIPANQVAGSEQSGNRPCIVMSRTSLNRRLNTVIVVPMTTHSGTVTPESLQNQPPFRIMVPVTHIAKDVTCTSTLSLSVAKADQARVIDKTRLGSKIGRLSPTAVVAVGAGLANVFDIR